MEETKLVVHLQIKQQDLSFSLDLEAISAFFYLIKREYLRQTGR